MKLYLNKGGVLQQLEEKRFKLEKHIQKMIEDNLQLLMNLEMVKSEFTIKNRRIDTLAYDQETKAFIIIEYKRDKNVSVIDQGFTYLSLMLENKADFVIEYNETLKKSLLREDVDWSQTRVAFVSTSFTENQIQATNFKDIAIELWEIKQFENETIFLNHIKKSASAESIKPITQQNQALKKVTDEIKVYTLQDNLENASDSISELFEKFKNAILNLTDGIEVVTRLKYVAFKKGRNISDIEIQKKSLKIYINLKKGKLDDPKKLAEDISSKGAFGNGDYRIQVTDDSNLEYILSLIKQAL